MKRQHPGNPDLYWCPKCGVYKPLTIEYWYIRPESSDGFRGSCKCCMNHENKRYVALNRKQLNNYRKEYNEQNGEKIRANKYKWANNHIKERRESSSKWQMKQIDNLTDCYIRKILSSRGIKISHQMIELKRQQITMIRTLKQFKEWRKQYESSGSDVQGE